MLIPIRQASSGQKAAKLAELLAKVAPKALMCGDSRSFVRHAGVDGHLGLSSLAGLKSVAWPAFWPG